MKISVCTIAFREEKLENILDKLSKFDIDGVEIWGQHIQKYIELDGKINDIKKMCDNYNFEIPVISPYFNFTGTEDDFNNSIKLAKSFVNYAVVLNAPIIRAFVSDVGSLNATQMQWNQCVAALKGICDFAKPKEIMFALETHPNQLMDTVDTTLELLDKVNKPNLKVILDIWHMFNEGEAEPLEALDRLYPYIVHIHAKNMKRDESKWCYMSEGDMDYEPFWKELKKREYNGFISIEWFGENSWKAVKNEIEYLKGVIK